MKNVQNKMCKTFTYRDERGSAMVIALMVMILLMGFVALAVSRTNSETVSAANDASETMAFEASNACLEVMTRNFNKNFETKLTFSAADEARIESQTPPGFPDYNFTLDVNQTEATRDVVMTGEMFQGLNARRDAWRLDCTSFNANNGVQVALSRTFLNDRIPIFQFGIFYDDDLEFHPGPRFDFGGRVHSNGSLYLMAQDGLYFSSKVSSADPRDPAEPRHQIFTDVSKNGTSYSAWGENVFIKNASGSYVQLRNNMGSALANTVNGAPVSTAPTAYTNANWPTHQNSFQGNLLAHVGQLQLPIKINSDISTQGLDNVEVVKRGKNVGDLWSNNGASPAGIAVVAATSDDKVTAAERYYNKTGIRVSLADGKAKLPGCATTTGVAVSTPCGIRLDGDAAGQGAEPTGGNPRGYLPKAMTDGYQATAINGNRFRSDSTRQVWIKIETVVYNPATITYDTLDITEEMLALGVTDAAQSSMTLMDSGYTSSTGNDSRSIFELQRFAIPGPTIPNTTSAPAGSTYITTSGGNNYVQMGTILNLPLSNRCSDNAVTVTATNANRGPIASSSNFFPTGFSGTDDRSLWRTMNTGSLTRYTCVVPFPINMFDTREGLYNDSNSVFNPTSGSNYGNNVPWAGVMSMIDIDVTNLRTFLENIGNNDSRMPAIPGSPFHTLRTRGLRSTDIPQNNGWVLYVSDRRGDYDFDGEYDMEDVFGNNNGNLDPGEDLNGNNTLQADFTNGEAVRYTGGTCPGTTCSHISPDIAAVFDHKFYRRGVRLVRGQRPPGGYDSATPANTRGFTFASENGVYVQGNYNATGITSVGTPTPSSDYNPQGADDVPASIAADAVTVLSSQWNDGKSYVDPFDLSGRVVTSAGTATTQRFAMIAGDTITTMNGTPNQGGGNPRMNGGVHNFLRFLERWDTRLNYAGSLINLYNSRNNNGTFKCCFQVYDPPERNWVFDATFLDVNRLPPGTPYFQQISMTGFQRVN